VGDLLLCADIYGIKSLKMNCFHYKLKSINKDNVIPTIMKGKRKEFEYDATEMIDLCFQFIEKNAFEVVKVKTFVELDFDGIIQICKSNELVIGEADLFDGVLNWGNAEAKKKSSTLDKILKDILPLIRFPMMDTEYLNNTVRPLKLVSKDDIEEAMNFQSNPNDFVNDKSDKFKPRASLFVGGSLVSPNHEMFIDSFLKSGSKGKIWKCIYKASKDGFATTDFHKHCDNKGATVTVIKSSNGNIFGGYCPLPWNTTSNYQFSMDSFLFSLVNSHKKLYHFKQTSTNGQYSIYGNSGYGPTFGGGHDIYIVGASNQSTSSYSNFGHSFDCSPMGGSYSSTQAQSFLAGSYSFKTSEIEVYSQQ
jgi:hypothetical protein